MRHFLLIVLVAIIIGGSSNDQGNSDYFSLNGIEGVIFKEPLPSNYKISAKRWLPSVSQVLCADSLVLRQNFKRLGGTSKENMIDNCPVIANNWDGFYRQVIGMENEKGQRILLLNYFWKADTVKFPQWKEEYVDMIGGCSYYWSVKFNMKKNRSFDLWIN